MYIPQDPPLVLHMQTSWKPASQPITSPHALAEVKLGLDSNGQSPEQKMNVLPLTLLKINQYLFNDLHKKEKV